MKKPIPIIREREGNDKKNIPKIQERKGNEKIHSHNSGKGIRGFHSWEWTGTGIPAHPCLRVPILRIKDVYAHLKHPSGKK